MASPEATEVEKVNPFDAVRDKIQFEGFSEPQQEVILDQLERSYNAEGGTTGREMIDAGIALPNGFTIHNSNSQSAIEDYTLGLIDADLKANPRKTFTPAQVDQIKLGQLNDPERLSSNYAYRGKGDVFINSYPSLETDPKTGVETTEVYDRAGMTRIGQSADGQPPIQSLDRNGEVYDVPPIQTLIHEANHAIRGEVDIAGNDPFTNGEYFPPA